MTTDIDFDLAVDLRPHRAVVPLLGSAHATGAQVLLPPTAPTQAPATDHLDTPPTESGSTVRLPAPSASLLAPATTATPIARPEPAGNHTLPTPPPAPAPTTGQEQAAAPALSAPKVAATAEIEAPPELVVPPEPRVETSVMVEWWANAFPHLVWLSVVSGLVGQIYGWTETFGGGLVAIAVACVLGGTFEFIMVAASSRGLRDIGRGRPIWQALAFLTAGTACMAMAFWMNLHHFTGALALAGVAAAASTAIGYLAHVAVHLFDELDNRNKRKEWKKDRDRVLAEIKARQDQARADHDAYQTELRKARSLELKSRTDQVMSTAVQVAAPATRTTGTETAPQAKPASKAPASKATEGRAAKTLTKEMALQWWAQNGRPGPATVRKHFKHAHPDWEIPVDRTLNRWGIKDSSQPDDQTN